MKSQTMQSLVAMVIATFFSLGSAALAAEWGVNRAGGDYKNFDLPSDQPSLCEQACSAEAQCKAWTFVRPGVQGPNARCWLKSSVPAPNNDDCCVSGVKQTSAGSFEQDRNRLGMDYKDFDLPSASPALCQSACDGEEQCRAWTYVKPGIQGPSARCWLKSDVPAAQVDDCCVSGVK